MRHHTLALLAPILLAPGGAAMADFSTMQGGEERREYDFWATFLEEWYASSSNIHGQLDSESFDLLARAAGDFFGVMLDATRLRHREVRNACKTKDPESTLLAYGAAYRHVRDYVFYVRDLLPPKHRSRIKEIYADINRPRKPLVTSTYVGEEIASMIKTDPEVALQRAQLICANADWRGSDEYEFVIRAESTGMNRSISQTIRRIGK